MDISISGIRTAFRTLATRCALALGSPWAFAIALLLVLSWAAAGPYFGYSDAWQLVINTATTIGTFLLVFVLQNTQIRDTKALNIKLDELLRAIDGARSGLMNVENLPDEEIDRLCSELQRLGRMAWRDGHDSGADRMGGREEAVARKLEPRRVAPASRGEEAHTRAALEHALSNDCGNARRD